MSLFAHKLFARGNCVCDMHKGVHTKILSSLRVITVFTPFVCNNSLALCTAVFKIDFMPDDARYKRIGLQLQRVGDACPISMYAAVTRFLRNG